MEYNQTMADQQYLDNLRHSASHLLAAAVLELFPDALLAIGPSIENGFYYDIDFRDTKLTEEDLPKIEEKMHELIKTWQGFERIEISLDDAKKQYQDNPYKLELIDEFSNEGEQLTVYKSGNFRDLCRGGHVEKPDEELKYFKLLNIAGAYWRGDEKNTMLTRIYGTAFKTKPALDKYLEQREEAKKRNHRTIGKDLELFEIFPEIGQGLPVWLPKGYVIRRELEDYMISLERSWGYEHILTPHISKSDLFSISGHLGFYDENMYKPIEIEDEKYYLKPMNCPAGMMVYKNKPRSYRDLPIKMGELGTVYRYEKSGELHGLQRVRGFTQNDAHIYCTKEQLNEQIEEVLKLLNIFYKAVGFTNYRFILAISDPDKDKFKACGTRKGWLWAENTLRDVLKSNNLEFEEQKGEAAFYGPKIDVEAINVFGKADAISTAQIDFNLPQRFGLKYTDPNGSKKEPIVIHRALVGSFERFFAFLIEHHGGAFPVWLSPVQVKILPITDKEADYSQQVAGKLKQVGARIEMDTRSETLQAKIRDAQLEKVPYMVVIGPKETQNNKITVRLRTGENLKDLTIEDFLNRVKEKIESKSLAL